MLKPSIQTAINKAIKLLQTAHDAKDAKSARATANKAIEALKPVFAGSKGGDDHIDDKPFD